MRELYSEWLEMKDKLENSYIENLGDLDNMFEKLSKSDNKDGTLIKALFDCARYISRSITFRYKAAHSTDPSKAVILESRCIDGVISVFILGVFNNDNTITFLEEYDKNSK